ncbi:hypothetical protein E1A91_A02G038600v1 [Gossypium mustelinum]|uniref:NADP-dependent oxidoreductase domain-containing protein n=1 Tax=Gossypium mustelinum TaxID=34275 RepID=A0A5D3A158_GOSMU|nr:hypothetical protein E1A91_A02G038600v1 [Gossypium mustelinum]
MEAGTKMQSPEKETRLEISTMSVQSVPTFPLRSTDEKAIPFIGFGTAEYPFGASRDTLKETIIEAFKLGNLKLEYVDLYLIHWPLSLKPGKPEFPFKKEDMVPMDIKSVWEAMEECNDIGLTKSIGVSNFSCKKLENLLSSARIPPAVNQVEMSPMWQQKKLRKFCEEKGIVVEAYSPLGARGTAWGTNQVMECDVLKEIAQAKGKSVAQVCLRWAYEQGVCVIVKSFNKERMKQNLDIFDWRLSDDELLKISQLPQCKGYPALDFVSDDGPFKSLQEFWDGEI